MARRALPRGWYWRSYEHHDQLKRGERWWVLGSFALGSLFMLTSVLGILAVVGATMRVTSDALDIAEAAAIDSTTDIDGEPRDAHPDAGPDELVRKP